MKIHTFSSKETERVGFFLAKKIAHGGEPCFLALRGDLGSGKTTLMKGFARGLKIKDEISSPTFVIFKKYEIKKDSFFYHFDAYRIIDEEELLVLGFSEIISNKNNIIAVEWSDNIKGLLPKKRVDMNLIFVNKNERELIIEGISDRMKGEMRARGSVG